MSSTLRPHGLQYTKLPSLSLSHGVCSNSCPLSSYAIQPTHPLLPPFSPALNLSQHEGILQWVSSSHQVARVLELQLQHQFFLHMDWAPWTRSCASAFKELVIYNHWVTSLSLFTCMHWRRKWQPTPVFLPRGSWGWGSLVGCHLWGCTESDTTEVT